MSSTSSEAAIPCLIVGAGPTGLALAAQLAWFGTPFRIVDRSLDRARESRALAVQARTLEVLDSLGLGERLVALGSSSTRIVIHLGARPVAEATLGHVGATDTRFPFILFVSQVETERILTEHLSSAGVGIERGVELVSFENGDTGIDCLLRHPDGREERVRAAYLIGCDGAHSAVRKGAGLEFAGGSYPEDFVLGDVEADGPLEPGALNPFVGAGGAAIFFPLGSPTTWRVIALRAESRARRFTLAADEATTGPLSLEELQSVVAVPTAGAVTVRDPAWLTHFRLHHRQVARYQKGRVFLAGDAAHIHSPVGGQGMNTGIQDAWNLGWKLAFVTSGWASPRLLDTYDAERFPVGRSLLRYTDRVFSVFTRALSAGRIASWARQLVVPNILPRLLRGPATGSIAFAFVSQLRIRYRGSPAVVEGSPRLRAGPRAGDRFPDARVVIDGRETSLQRAVVGPNLALVLCGDPGARNDAALARLSETHAERLRIHWLDAGALSELGVREPAQYLVRPDGYVAFRCAGSNLDALTRYLDEWFALTSGRR